MEIDSRKIWNEIQENHKKLDSCDKHDFSIDLKPGQTFSKKYQCSKCGGTVEAIAKVWYEKGLKHGAVV